MRADELEAALRLAIVLDTGVGEQLASAVSVYREEAPPGAALPFVVYQKQVGTPMRTLGERWGDDATYIIKGITQGHSSLAGGSIDASLDALLDDGTLGLSAGSLLYSRRVEDVDYAEQAPGGVRYNHRGGLYRFWTTP